MNDLPIDILKIDRSFTSGQDSTGASVPMLEGILGLADKLSLKVIAEGINTTTNWTCSRIWAAGWARVTC